MNKYPHLFEPIQIGTQTVKNRVFMPPISTNLANKCYVTDELVQHYGARAKGGVGLNVSEVVTVEPTYIYLPGDMSIHDDSFIPGWEKLCAEVHKYDTKILAQLFHPAYMAFPIPGTPQLIAPSHVGPYYARSAPRPVTRDELKVLVRQFGEAALRVKTAGGDGVGGGSGTACKPGKDGISATHSWNGTVLTITSASGTSSADLKGSTGDPGKTPVRGTDYWTAADIAEIKSYVDEAILGGAW